MSRKLLSEEERLLRRKASVAKYNKKIAEKQRVYMQEYQQRDYVKDNYKVYRKQNPARQAMHQRLYCAAKSNRIPQWDIELTSFVTEEAHSLRLLRNKLFMFTWDVDHIIPLRGKQVSGLHVWNNLQVIPSSINRSKRNEYSDTK